MRHDSFGSTASVVLEKCQWILTPPQICCCLFNRSCALCSTDTVVFPSLELIRQALVTYITRKYVVSQNKTFKLSNVLSNFVCKQLIMDRTTQHTTRCTFCKCDTLHSLQNFVSFIVSHFYWFSVIYFWFVELCVVLQWTDCKLVSKWMTILVYWST